MPQPQWEFNFAAGLDNVLGKDLEWSSTLVDEYPIVYGRNHAAFGNVIFRPRSNLLLSLEYRKLWTWDFQGHRNLADQINLAAGVSF
jgi:hypothetical protein